MLSLLFVHIYIYIYMFTDITTLEYGESKSIQLMLCSNNTPALEGKTVKRENQVVIKITTIIVTYKLTKIH